MAEYDPTGAEIRSYGYRLDSTWTTDPLWLKQDGEHYFYHNDHLGTPQKLVAQNGAVVWSASYTAFGQATVEVETVTNNLRFPGQYYDVETGLYYNYFRYYSFEVGKYLRRDPIGFLGGDVNLYRYVRNNPLNFKDSGGLSSFWQMVNFNHGNNPLNKEIQIVKKKINKINSLLPEGGAFTGVESHLFFGNGLTWLTCCDSKTNRLKKMIFSKGCFGVAIGFGGFVGATPNFDCNYESYEGWFFETGFGTPWGALGADFGKKPSEWKIPFLGIPFPTNQPSGVDEFEWGPAMGVPQLMLKATWCYYTMIYWEEIGCCRK